MNRTAHCKSGEEGTAKIVAGVCTTATTACYARCAFHPDRTPEPDAYWVGVFCPRGVDYPTELAGAPCPDGQGCLKACPSRQEA